MLSKQEITARWNELKGRLQEHWGQLTEHDLHQARGTTGELVDIIQQKTGASRREIEMFITQMVEDSEKMSHRVADTANEYAESAQQYAEEAAQLARQGYQRAAMAGNDISRKVMHSVRERPTESLAIAFGVGVLAGALLLFGRRGR